jgi:pimeloyl-ACP methyl ester carboxylesterase
VRRVAIRARDGLVLSAVEHPGPEGRTPLLCLSGLTRSAGDFSRIAARHAGARRVIALEHAGHGESGRPEDIRRYGIDSSLRDVLDAMAALHAPRAVIIGTSYGGLLAMVLAVLRPTAIAGVVLNDIGPVMETEALGDIGGFLGEDPALPSLEAAAEHLRARLPPMRLDEAGWRDFAALTYRTGEDGLLHPRWDTRIAQVLRGNGPPPPLWGPFGALAHVPLMLVRGALSNLLSEATAARMQRERPDMVFVSVAGSGHCPTLHEAEVVPVLDAFLDAIA